MPEPPEKFVVSLSVDLAVFARYLFEARKTAQEWLQQTVSQAYVVEPNLVLTYGPRVTASASARGAAERVSETRDWEARDKAEIAEARKLPEYGELVRRAKEAETTDEYLEIGHDVQRWKEENDPFYALPLVDISRLLDTLAEAVRWSETHPNGPAVWNMGGLFASLKRLADEEYDAVRSRSERPLAGTKPN